MDKLITFDMGGTSTDVALINTALPLTFEASISDFPVKVPMIDIHTVGAGGGSISCIDAGGSLKVGLRVISVDQYPYNATSTTINAFFPPRALEGTFEDIKKRLKDSKTRAQILEVVIFTLVSQYKLYNTHNIVNIIYFFITQECLYFIKNIHGGSRVQQVSGANGNCTGTGHHKFYYILSCHNPTHTDNRQFNGICYLINHPDSNRFHSRT